MPRARHHPILMLLACALALRMLVPVGWMPAASGAFAIEPCPAAEVAPMIAMASHYHDAGHHSHKAHHDGDCAFAPLTNTYAAADSPAMRANAVPAAALLGDAPGLPLFATGPPALPPPATGPPAIA